MDERVSGEEVLLAVHGGVHRLTMPEPAAVKHASRWLRRWPPAAMLDRSYAATPQQNQVGAEKLSYQPTREHSKDGLISYCRQVVSS